MIDRKKFFDGVRNNPFDKKLTTGQVAGMNAILNEWERRKLTDLRWLADMLGTAKWETDHSMQPIKEKGGDAYYTKLYDVRGSRPETARKNGNTTPGDGPKYCGRGYVQLTWKSNYAKMTKLLRAAGIDVDLVANPDLAMRSDIAAFVMFEGMIAGTFTGKKLSDYFNATKTDWIMARSIINGRRPGESLPDKAVEIAAISKAFYADLALAAA